MLGGQQSLGRENSPCKVPGGLEKWRRPLWLGREGGDEDREVMGQVMQGLWVEVRTLSSSLSEMGVLGSF